METATILLAVMAVGLATVGAAHAHESIGTPPEAPVLVLESVIPINYSLDNYVPGVRFNMSWNAPHAHGGTITNYVFYDYRQDPNGNWPDNLNPTSMFSQPANATHFVGQMLCEPARQFRILAHATFNDSSVRGELSNALVFNDPCQQLKLPPTSPPMPSPPGSPQLVNAMFGEGKYLQLQYSENTIAVRDAYQYIDFGNGVARPLIDRPHAGDRHHINYVGSRVNLNVGDTAKLIIDPTKILNQNRTQVFSNNSTTYISVYNPIPPPTPPPSPPPNPPPNPPPGSSVFISATIGEGKYIQMKYSKNILAQRGAYSSLNVDGDTSRLVMDRAHSGSTHHLNYNGTSLWDNGKTATLTIDPTKIYESGGGDRRYVFSNQTTSIPVHNPNAPTPPPPEPPDLSELQAMITALQDTVASLTSTLARINDTVAGMNATMTDLTARVAVLENRTKTPEPISDLRATFESDPDHILLTWTGPNAVSYTIRESTSSPDGPWTVKYQTRNNLLIVQNPDPDTTYYFQVSRGSLWSNTTSVTIPALEPTGVNGRIYTDTNNNNQLDPGERGRAGIEVITVNLADHSDVQRLRTDANGDYSFELSAGGYLVQAIGGGPSSYAYVTIPDGTMLVRNLAY